MSSVMLSLHPACLLCMGWEARVQSPAKPCAAQLPQQRHGFWHQCDSRGRVIPSENRQTDFPRLPLLHGGRRCQLKGRAEFRIIPEYILCTQLFLIQCPLTLWHLLGRGNGAGL